jgi:sugar-specific transcriptional regulator TrmB
MSEDSEKARALAAIKEYLERRIKELQDELETLKSMRSFVDEELTSISFKRATEARPAKPSAPAPAPAPQPEAERLRVLKSRSGEILARVAISPNEVRFLIEPKINLTRDSRPLQSFLLKKVLEPMSKSDRERVDKGLIPPGHELDYDIIYEGDRVKEMVVRNFREEYRLREIVNAVRWTLETTASEAK